MCMSVAILAQGVLAAGFPRTTAHPMTQRPLYVCNSSASIEWWNHVWHQINPSGLGMHTSLNCPFWFEDGGNDKNGWILVKLFCNNGDCGEEAWIPESSHKSANSPFYLPVIVTKPGSSMLLTTAGIRHLACSSPKPCFIVIECIELLQ